MYLKLVNGIKVFKNDSKVFLDCGILPNGAGTTIYTANSGFNKINIYDVFSNTHPSNLNNSIFTIPVKGIYLLYSKVRPTYTSGNVSVYSYGQGVHTSEIDGSWFMWANSFTGSDFNRDYLQNTRISQFNIGDLLRLYAYFPTTKGISAASLQVYLLEET